MRDDLILTRAAALALGVRPDALLQAIRQGKVAAPAMRDASGRYWWTSAEISAARARLAIDLRRREVVRIPDRLMLDSTPPRIA